MGVRVDEKGKYFTDVITKNSVWTVIQTLTHRIHGQVYIRPEQRVKDALNQAEQFIAVTNAVVYDASGMELFRSNFLTLNRDHIIWLTPSEDLQNNQERVGGED